MDEIKRKDQIALLKTCYEYHETGKWTGLFSYPGCAQDLIKTGLVEEGGKITLAGHSALWYLDLADDPTNSKSFVEFTLTPRKSQGTEEENHGTTNDRHGE
jgi:hypothetical protein